MCIRDRPRTGLFGGPFGALVEKASGCLNGVQEIVDVGIVPEAVALAERVVCHSNQLVGFQQGAFRPTRKVGRFDEFRIIMRAFGQHFEHIVGTNHGKQVSLGIAVDRGEKDMTARFDQYGTGGNDADVYKRQG